MRDGSRPTNTTVWSFSLWRILHPGMVLSLGKWRDSRCGGSGIRVLSAGRVDPWRRRVVDSWMESMSGIVPGLGTHLSPPPATLVLEQYDKFFGPFLGQVVFI